jgi:hypothetical protein
MPWWQTTYGQLPISPREDKLPVITDALGIVELPRQNVPRAMPRTGAIELP